MSLLNMPDWNTSCMQTADKNDVCAAVLCLLAAVFVVKDTVFVHVAEDKSGAWGVRSRSGSSHQHSGHHLLLQVSPSNVTLNETHADVASVAHTPKIPSNLHKIQALQEQSIHINKIAGNEYYQSEDSEAVEANFWTRIMIGTAGITAWLTGLGFYYYNNVTKTPVSLSHVKGQSNLEAITNFANMYTGIGFWGLPYSVYLGGFISLPLLLLLCFLCYLSLQELIKIQRRNAPIRRFTSRSSVVGFSNNIDDSPATAYDSQEDCGTEEEEEDEFDDNDGEDYDDNALSGGINYSNNTTTTLFALPSSMTAERMTVEGGSDDQKVDARDTRDAFSSASSPGSKTRHPHDEEEKMERREAPDMINSIPLPTSKKLELEGYLDIVQCKWGFKGKLVSSLLVAAEYFGIIILLLLTMWDITSRVYGVKAGVAVALNSAMLFPFLFKADWISLANINAASVIVLFVSIASLLAFVISNTEAWTRLAPDTTQGGGQIPSGSNFMLCIGLQMTSLAGGTPSIPSIYSQTERKSGFMKGVLFPAMLVSATTLLFGAWFGFAAFGDDIEVIVVDNVVDDNNFGAIAGLLVWIACFATAISFISLSAKIVTSTYHGDNVVPKRHDILCRMVVFFLHILASWTLIENTYMVLEVTGILCMSTNAFIVPNILSLQEFYKTDSWAQKVFKNC